MDWHWNRVHGTPAAVEAWLRARGWRPEGEEPAEPADPGQVVHGPLVLDGVAYAAISSTTPLPPQPDLTETGAELSAALLGIN